jgi:transposase-like protein
MARDFIEVCPKCKSTKITIRKRKAPKYRCHDCGNEFHDPKTRIANTSQKQKDDFGKRYYDPDE